MNDPSAPLPAADSLALALMPSGIAAAGIATAGILATNYVDDDGIDGTLSLPADHPAWQRDVLAISARVRAMFATLRPVAVRVLTFWDHVARTVAVGGGHHVEIDPSGCYRLR